MLRQRSSSIVTLMALLALAPVSVAVIQAQQVAQAQSPAGATTVRIGSSPSVDAISQTLKRQFEAKFPGSRVELNQTASAEAIKALQEGKVDLAAVGRPLTPEEKAAGLVQEPIARRKIAVVVGDKNPFPGDLTGEQFAAIFRGEITNWSQVGGSNRPIRVLDRLNSDTRVALQPYPVFQTGAFQTGSTGVQVQDAATDAMVSQLGEDGISYAAFDQVANRPGVKIVSLYGTLPSDPSYPFSQPLAYVYKGPNPSPAAQSFLGFVRAPEGQQSLAASAPAAPAAPVVPVPIAPVSPPSPVPAPNIAAPGAAAPGIAASPAAPGSPSPAVAAQPSVVAQAPGAEVGDRTGIPLWLWALSLPLLGCLIWALLKGLGGSDEEVEEAPARSRPVSTAAIAAERAGENSRIVLTPRNAHEAYAYWEVPESHKLRLRQEEGGQKLALRLYDVTGLEFDRHPAHSIQEFECAETDQDAYFPIPQTDRDYLVELGYVTYQGRWVKLAQSNPVRITADGTPGPVQPNSVQPNFVQPNPVPPSAQPPAVLPATLPMLPTFSQDGNSFNQTSQTGDQTNFGEAVPLVEPIEPVSSAPAPTLDLEDSRPAVLLETVEPAAAPEPSAILETPAAQAVEAEKAPKTRVKRSQITLSPRSAQDAEAEWEVLEHHKEIAKQHGGQTFILRICDVTGVDLEHQAPHSIQQFNCEESDTSRTVTVPDNGEYVAEIGYLAKNGRWLRIARSAPVHIPAAGLPEL